jgi:hypothetical protein
MKPPSAMMTVAQDATKTVDTMTADKTSLERIATSRILERTKIHFRGSVLSPRVL